MMHFRVLNNSKPTQSMGTRSDEIYYNGIQITLRLICLSAGALHFTQRLGKIDSSVTTNRSPLAAHAGLNRTFGGLPHSFRRRS